MTQPAVDASKPSSTNRDITDRLIYPLLSRVVVFIPRKVHPNVLTIAAILSSFLAAAVLALSASPASFLFCAGLLVAWILLDSCDGIHARNTGQCSQFGSFLDHFGDACGMFFLQVAIIYRFDLHEPAVFGALLLRQALASWTYIIQVHAGKLYIASLGWSFEIYAYAALMIAIFFMPTLQFQIFFFPEMNLLSNVLLIYYIAVPLTLLEIGLVIFNQRKSSQKEK